MVGELPVETRHDERQTDCRDTVEQFGLGAGDYTAQESAAAGRSIVHGGHGSAVMDGGIT